MAQKRGQIAAGRDTFYKRERERERERGGGGGGGGETETQRERECVCNGSGGEEAGEKSLMVRQFGRKRVRGHHQIMLSWIETKLHY